jgi:hypothetical protein
MKRAASQNLRFFLIVIIATIISPLNPASAGVLFTTITSSGSTYGFITQIIAYEPITIPSAATITSLEMKIAVTPASGMRVDIYSDSAGSPSTTLLGSLTYSSYSAPTGYYTGAVSLPSAGTYWFKFTTTSGFQNYYSMTPVLTGSASGWSVGRMRESTNSGSTFATRGDNLAFLMTINGTGGGLAPAATSISLSGNSTATYRQSVTISATLAVAGSDGLVTFYANGKKIPGCIGKKSVSLAVSCSFRPATRGVITTTARLTPTDSGYVASTASAKSILVSNRSSTR